MNNLLNHVLHGNIRILNHAGEKSIFSKPNNPMASFAIDDAIATTVSEGKAAPTFRIWVHKPTIVLGIPDSRLPFLMEGLSFLKENNYDAIVRNSGGLAVALDEDVINLSIILPNAKHVSIDEGYEMMYHFIQTLFSEWTNDILAYEIVGSYCPGDYDLSIHGKKFAGISQRRVRDGVAVQIYLDIAGNARKRAALVRDFYGKSKQEANTSYTYPDVNPAVMASINELLQTTFTTEQFITKIIGKLTENATSVETNLLHEEASIFEKRYEQMLKRNEKVIQAFE